MKAVTKIILIHHAFYMGYVLYYKQVLTSIFD